MGNNEKLYSDLMFQTAREQIDEYGGLMKVAVSGTRERGIEELLVGVGGNFSTEFIMNNTTGHNDAWKTSLSTIVGAQIQSVDMDDFVAVGSSGCLKKDLNCKETKTIFEESNPIYTLPNYHSVYNFRATRSGLYDFKLGNATDLSLEVKNNDETAVIAENGNYNLEANKEYLVEIASTSLSNKYTTLSINVVENSLSSGIFVKQLTIPTKSYFLLGLKHLTGEYSILSTNRDVRIANFGEDMGATSNILNINQYFIPASGEKYLLLYNDGWLEAETTVYIESIGVLQTRFAPGTDMSMHPKSYSVMKITDIGGYSITSSNANCKIREVGGLPTNIATMLSLSRYDLMISETKYVWFYNSSETQQTTNIKVLEPTAQDISSDHKVTLEGVNQVNKIFKINLPTDDDGYKISVPNEKKGYSIYFYSQNGSLVNVLSNAVAGSSMSYLLRMSNVIYLELVANDVSGNGDVTISIEKFDNLGKWYINGAEAEYVNGKVNLYKETSYTITYKIDESNIFSDWTPTVINIKQGTDLYIPMSCLESTLTIYIYIKIDGEDLGWRHLAIKPIDIEDNSGFINQSITPNGAVMQTTKVVTAVPAEVVAQAELAESLESPISEHRGQKALMALLERQEVQVLRNKKLK